MGDEISIKSLHPLEIRTLLGFEAAEEFDTNTMIERLGFNLGQCNQAISWLAAKGCIKEELRQTRTFHELTPLGEDFAEKGTPEERMIFLLKEKGPMKMPEISAALELPNKDVGSAFGQMSKEGLLSMDEEKKVKLISEDTKERTTKIRSFIDTANSKGAIDESTLTEEDKKIIRNVSKKRGASDSIFKTIEREEARYSLSETGVSVKKELEKAGLTGEEIGALTPEMLADESFRGKRFRAYNINTPANRVLLGRRNPYGRYLDHVKDTLTSLGFEEFDGPLVETEFWNCDALFMPQFHAARDIHDVYYIKNPSHAREIEQPYLDQVAATHRDGWKTGSLGWRYDFDHDFTRRLILRSQGTVLSAKQLKNAKVPGKYFGIVRCFRYDRVDATHLSDFYQTEGIVLGEDVNLRTLMGFLRMFAEELAGASEVKYVPGYFPFTEPSVEVHIKHPELGWFELGGSGIFRPEVTEPMGISVPVLAWGLGIDRMALMHLGLNDLRELFSTNIENVRLRRSS